MKGMELNVDFAPQEHRLERFKSTRKLLSSIEESHTATKHEFTDTV